MKNKGLFLSFEGPEASGKSTQIKLLKKYLVSNKINFIITREPGGTPISETLRKIILEKKNQISTNEEILLLMASRMNHINKIILPALYKNKIVISDRYADSTFVYQGYVNKFGMNRSIRLHKLLLNNFLPKKTFLFKISSNEIIKRLKKRKNKNKYDIIDKVFHKKVISGYNKLSKNNHRFIIIDSTKSILHINNKIIQTINRLYKI